MLPQSRVWASNMRWTKLNLPNVSSRVQHLSFAWYFCESKRQRFASHSKRCLVKSSTKLWTRWIILTYGKLAPDSSIFWRDSLEYLCWRSRRLCWMQNFKLNRMVLFSNGVVGQKTHEPHQKLGFFSKNHKIFSSPDSVSYLCWL